MSFFTLLWSLQRHLPLWFFAPLHLLVHLRTTNRTPQEPSHSLPHRDGHALRATHLMHPQSSRRGAEDHFGAMVLPAWEEGTPIPVRRPVVSLIPSRSAAVVPPPPLSPPVASAAAG